MIGILVCIAVAVLVLSPLAYALHKLSGVAVLLWCSAALVVLGVCSSVTPST